VVSAAAARGGDGDVVTGDGDGVAACDGGGGATCAGVDSATPARGAVGSGIERYGGRAGGSRLRRPSDGAGRVRSPATLVVERGGAVEPGGAVERGGVAVERDGAVERDAAVGGGAAATRGVVAEFAGGAATASRRGGGRVSSVERAGGSAALGSSGFSGAFEPGFSAADFIGSVGAAGTLVSGATLSASGAAGGGAGDDDGRFAA
jgi:hypothetical protein